jgi:hypothetical protein
MRYETNEFWARNHIIRYGAIDRELGLYQELTDNQLPGFTVEHCSYCFGSVQKIIRKLQDFAHTEFSSGKFVDPHHVLARLLCGQHIFDHRPPLALRDMGKHELDLPPQGRFYGWRLPFTDLDEMNLNISEIQQRTECRTSLKLVQGKLTGYE